MASPELMTVTKEIRVGLGEAVGQLRQASTQNSSLLGKVVKDIATMFSSQRRNIMDMSNNLSEYFDENVKTTSKLQELLAMQNSIIAELRNISGNIRILGETQASMQNNIIRSINGGNSQSLIDSILGGGATSLLGGLSALIPSFAKELISFGLGAAAGYFGGQLLSKFGFGGGDQVGQMGGDGADVPGIKTSGNLAQNQQEAYKAARAEGLSDSAAKIAVANVSGENLKNPGGVYADPSNRNPNQKAHGIVAWDDERAATIKQTFGKYPQEMSVAEQTKAYIWEMRTHYKQAYNDLVNENLTDQQRLHSVVANFEKPKDVSGAVKNRMGFLKGFTPKAGSEPTPSKGETATEGTQPHAERMSAAEEPRTDASLLDDSHAEKEKAPSDSLPSGNIVALGRSLEKMGIRVSEHPSFGGVSAGHAPGSAHFSGRAIDINAKNVSGDEANDPVWGPKFDELSRMIQSSGYKVLWRTKGHYNHIHAQIGGEGIKGGESIVGGQGGAPGSNKSQTTMGGDASPAEGSAAPSIDPKAIAEQSDLNVAKSMLGLQSEPSKLQQFMGPRMSGLGSVIPMASMLMSSMTSPAAAADLAPPQITRSATNSSVNNQTMLQSAVEKQARQEMAQQKDIEEKSEKPVESPVAANQYVPTDQGYTYNPPWDHGWMDWGQLIGGNHWSELSNFKTHMWK